MRFDIPFEIAPLRAHLFATFDGHLPPSLSGGTEARARNFLSRALAAYAVQNLADADIETASAAIIDGNGDGGIDALYYAPNSHTLWLIQSKFIAEGRGEPSLSDVSKFADGVESLLSGRWEAFARNTEFQALIPQLQLWFRDESLQVRGVLLYSSETLVSEDQRRRLEATATRFNRNDNYFEYQIHNLTSISDWLTGLEQGLGVEEVELELFQPGWVRTPYETIYGLLPFAELHRLKQQYQDRVIAANIRRYRGQTDVNEQIETTAHSEPEHFFYLNNGLTAYCQRFHVDHQDRDKPESKRVTAYGFSIVNGAQTLDSVHQCFGKEDFRGDQGYVLIKVISLQRCPDEREFAERITRSTNFQNQITQRDFVSLDDQQVRLAKQLGLGGINYHYKLGNVVPPQNETNFTLDEAATALACLFSETTGQFCARILSDRKRLIVQDRSQPGEMSNYERLFGSITSARTIWRAVQVQRIVIAQMQSSMRGVSGSMHQFYENVRWLVLNLVFLRENPHRGEPLQLDEALTVQLQTKAQQVADALWTACRNSGIVTTAVIGGNEIYSTNRHMKSIFSNPTDCAQLRAAALAILNQPAAP